MGYWEWFDITPNPSITDATYVSNCMYKPVTREVIINFRLWSGSGLIPTSTYMVKIPTKYRPVVDVGGFISITLLDVLIPGVTNTSVTYPENTAIGTNGEIYLTYFLKNTNRKFVWLSAIYKSAE